MSTNKDNGKGEGKLLMVIHCAACQATDCRMTGNMHEWLDTEGNWRYHEIECLKCGVLLWLDERGFTHVLREKQASTTPDLTHPLLLS